MDMSEVKKCIVWDLDNTLWDGVCLEGEVSLREEVVRSIRELDRRGILHSIASRGDEDLALKVLRDHAIDGLFLAPRIGWLPKSQSIVQISQELGISTDSMAFVDDDPFEREQIEFMLPGVLTIDAQKSPLIPAMPEFTPGILTSEAAGRRLFYQSEVRRQSAAAAFSTREDFLKSCGMNLTIRAMKEENIPRVVELMSRTHQLNTTGWLFGADEVAGLLRRDGDSRMIAVAELEDRFGSYGIIGTAIVETLPQSWSLKYLAVSCRVLGRGVERAFLVSLLREACAGGFARVEAAYRDTGKNRMMRALYQMVGLQVAGECGDDGELIFVLGSHEVPEIPPWVSVL
jgi:FkbH-like protein